MQQIYCGCSLFDQIAVAHGKWVGIHDDGTDFRVLSFFTFEESRSFSLQTFQVVRKAGPAVFHENNLALYPGNLVKTQITKETRSIAFCIQKETGVATAVLKLDQMGDDLVHQAFTLVLGRNSHAAQCVGKTGAGCHKIVIIIKQSDAVIKIFVPLDSFFF